MRKVGDIRNSCANNPKLDFFINVVIIEIMKQQPGAELSQAQVGFPAKH